MHVSDRQRDKPVVIVTGSSSLLGQRLMRKNKMQKQYGLSIAITLWLMFSLSGALAQQTGDQTSAEDVKRELGELLETINAYTFAQKEAYQQTLEAKLHKFDTHIETLRARAEDTRKETRAKLDEQLETLRRKREALRSRLQQFQTASAKSWDDIKSGIAAATDDLLHAYEEAKSHF